MSKERREASLGIFIGRGTPSDKDVNWGEGEEGGLVFLEACRFFKSV